MSYCVGKIGLCVGGARGLHPEASWGRCSDAVLQPCEVCCVGNCLGVIRRDGLPTLRLGSRCGWREGAVELAYGFVKSVGITVVGCAACACRECDGMVALVLAYGAFGGRRSFGKLGGCAEPCDVHVDDVSMDHVGARACGGR